MHKEEFQSFSDISRNRDYMKFNFPTFPDISLISSQHFPTTENVRKCRGPLWWGTLLTGLNSLFLPQLIEEWQSIIWFLPCFPSPDKTGRGAMTSWLGECEGFYHHPTPIPTLLLDFAKFKLHFRQVKKYCCHCGILWNIIYISPISIHFSSFQSDHVVNQNPRPF